jgi:succinate dehydrogenase / fumarate reductase cytochrome b subunit
MGWFGKFLASSIGQKLIMSLTGLFLIVFLQVHLLGNLQLLKNDGGIAFNHYAAFMGHNPLIKSVSYGLYLFILLHAIQGILLWMRNRAAKGMNYAVSTSANASFAAKNMAWLGILIFVFTLIHMGDFWWAMKSDNVPMVEYDGISYQNLYEKVAVSFKNPIIVIFYVIAMIGLALHLQHGFQSAFQTLGINHKKYTPAIKFLGLLFSIIVPLAYAIIPIVFFLWK